MEIKYIGPKELYTSTLYTESTIEECLEWLHTLSMVSLDTETQGLFDHKNHIVMLQLYDNLSDVAFVIDVRQQSIMPLKERLESIIVLGQNLKFDYKFLKLHGIELNYIYDTLLGEAILTTGVEDRRLNLKHLVKKYCDVELSKEQQTSFVGMSNEPFTEAQIVYGIKDVTYLHKIRDKQLEELTKLDLLNLVKLEMETCLVLGDIEYNGFGLNVDKWKELAKKALINVNTYQLELDSLAKSEPNLQQFILKKVQGNLFEGIEEGYTRERDVNIKWTSAKQTLKVFKELGLPVDKANEKILSKFQNNYPLVKKFIDFKKQTKLTTTYGTKFLDNINSVTGRIHTEFWQILNTGRISSGNKNSKGAPNMQNLPANNDYRNCFIPAEGNKIVSCDFSG